MSRNTVNIEFGAVPTIATWNEMQDATAELARKNAAYVVAQSLEVGNGLPPFTTTLQKVGAAIYGLNKISQQWFPGLPISYRLDATADVGFHGNLSSTDLTQDVLFYDHTPVADEPVTVTFADAMPSYPYASPETINLYLTRLLAEGQTDPRYADPESFRQVALTAGQSVLYRLNDRKSGLPLLHDFRTGDGIRDVEVTPIFRMDLLDYTFSLAESAASRYLRRFGSSYFRVL